MSTSPIRAFAILIIVAFTASILGTIFFWVSGADVESLFSIWVAIFFLSVAVPISFVGFLVSFVGGIAMFYHLFAMLAYVDEDWAQESWVIRFNPFHVIYLPHHLTEPGLIARRKVFRGLLLFFGGMLLSLPAIWFTGSTF